MRRLIKKSENKMKIVYALESFPTSFERSIFLAGPTPRSNEIQSWRKEAIEILEKINYDGVVFIPEPRNGNFTKDYNKQIDWETEGLNKADCIIFWIPRELRSDFENIALTTNIEWGVWSKSDKFVMGFPKEAEKVRYIEHQLKELQQPCFYTLEDTIKGAINKIGEGSLRQDGETCVPLYIWNTSMFKNWYEAQKKVGNELRYAKLEYVFSMPKAKKVFLWVLKVHVYIKEEDRVKDNEFVLARTDICSAVLYKKAINLEDSEIVLVKEFRSPANNDECFIYEIPGGSSHKEEDNIDVIHDEIKEELGLEINKNKLQYVISRQLAGTLSSHRSHLYKLELSEEEINKLKQDKSVHGVIEDTEMTYIEVKTLKEILSNNLLDWTNIGEIFTALQGE